MSRFILLLLALVPLPLMAASSPRILAWDNEIAARKLAIVSGKDVIPLQGISSLRRSAPLQVKGEGPYFIRALDKTPGADGKPVEVACPIPEKTEKPLQ